MNFFKKLVYPYIGWAAFTIVIPMFLIFLYAMTKRGSNDVISLQFTIENFLRVFNFSYLKVIGNSFWMALITTVFCILIGYPIAYAIARLTPRMQGIFMLLVTVPMWINVLVRTYSLISLFSDVGIINNLLRSIGLQPIHMMWTPFAVVFGMIYNFLPFMILSIYTVISKIDPAIVQASYDLGANRRQTFLRIVLPLSLPGIISGITMVFLPAVSSFEIPQLLGGGSFTLVGTLIESQFVKQGNWNFGAAISLFLALIIMITMHFTNKIDKDVEATSQQASLTGGN